MKTVTNDNGGSAAATAWTLTANGSGANDISGATGSTAVTSATVSADTFALSESGPLNYTAGNWSCVRTGTNTAATMPTATSVTVPVGDDVTCTINNNDNAPALHLRKTVTNDNGGTALRTAWTADGQRYRQTPTNLSGATPVDSRCLVQGRHVRPV